MVVNMLEQRDEGLQRHAEGLVTFGQDTSLDSDSKGSTGVL
jgi:hypothetical protein